MDHQIMGTRAAAKFLQQNGVKVAGESTMRFWRRVGRGPRYVQTTAGWTVYAIQDLENWLEEIGRNNGHKGGTHAF